MVAPLVAGAAIAAGANILGGFLQRDAANKTNKQALQQAALNRHYQEQFAKSGIQWRVADAKAAGIHPLYALGANTPTYTPVSANFTTPDYSFVGRMGQDIGRGLQAYGQRQDRLDAQKVALNRQARLDNMSAIESAARTRLLNTQADYYQSRIRPQAGVGGVTGTGASGSLTKNPLNTGQNKYMADNILRGVQLTRVVPGVYFVGPTEKFKQTIEDMGPFPWQAWAGLISRRVNQIAPYPARTGHKWVWNRATNFVYEVPYGATRRTINDIERRIRQTLQVKGKQISGSHGHIRK